MKRDMNIQLIEKEVSEIEAQHCMGCIAQDKDELCDMLRSKCNHKNIIYVLKEVKP